MAVNELNNLGEIRSRVYEMIEDDASSQFWTPNMLNGFIFAEHQVLVNKIIEQYENFFTTRSTTDIIAGQEFYGLPAGARKIVHMEHRTAAGADDWRNIDPITEGLQQRTKFWAKGGRGVSGVDLRDRSVTITKFHLWAGGFMLTPFFNTGMTAGLRIWWVGEPTRPSAWVALGNTEDSWVPFNSLLVGHHEILAAGAAIRCKKREEVPDSWGDMYSVLWRLMGNACENRQVMESKQTPTREGYYP